MITPLIIAASANGNIRNYQIILGGIMLTIVPISYIFLKLGYNPTSVFYVHLVISAITLVIRLYFAYKLNNLNIISYVRNVIVKSIMSVLPLFIILYLFHSYLLFNVNGYIRLLTTIIYMAALTVSFYYWGLNQPERSYIISKIKSYRII